jgi:hypothetical protein
MAAPVIEAVLAYAGAIQSNGCQHGAHLRPVGKAEGIAVDRLVREFCDQASELQPDIRSVEWRNLRSARLFSTTHSRNP